MCIHGHRNRLRCIGDPRETRSSPESGEAAPRGSRLELRSLPCFTTVRIGPFLTVGCGLDGSRLAIGWTVNEIPSIPVAVAAARKRTLLWHKRRERRRATRRRNSHASATSLAASLCPQCPVACASCRSAVCQGLGNATRGNAAVSPSYAPCGRERSAVVMFDGRPNGVRWLPAAVRLLGRKGRGELDHRRPCPCRDEEKTEECGDRWSFRVWRHGSSLLSSASG